jgi:hypothetical protein
MVAFQDSLPCVSIVRNTTSDNDAGSTVVTDDVIRMY